MKKFIKLFFKFILTLILILSVLGVIFYMVDTTRVNNDFSPRYTFLHKIIDRVDGCAIQVDYGLGYKIVRIEVPNSSDIIRVGGLTMDENCDELLGHYVPTLEDLANEMSGEKIAEEKKTTFGEAYQDTIMLEGEEEIVDVKEINSKLEYSMKYYFDLFEYTGYDDHDNYVWNLMPSGDTKAMMTIKEISGDSEYQNLLKKIKSEKYEEVSGEQAHFVKNYMANKVPMKKYIYILQNETRKLKVEFQLVTEALEGIGVYMHKMLNSIKF